MSPFRFLPSRLDSEADTASDLRQTRAAEYSGPRKILVLKKIIELLPSKPSSAIKQVIIDFKRALWAAFTTVLPAVSIKGSVFHWTQAVEEGVRARPAESVFGRRCCMQKES
ncbi:uncharacterized protein [Acropora muricata]|uniref:uncharacterized protein n=1 Tax=Acropora muricata TaxID=159855 RepID=UPI0034E5A966